MVNENFLFWLIPVAATITVVTYLYLNRKKTPIPPPYLDIDHDALTRSIGVNISNYVYYSSEFLFVDVFKNNSGWLNSDYLPETRIPLRADGYPVRVPYNDGGVSVPSVLAFILRELPSVAMPDGEFTLLAEGTGTIHIRAGANINLDCPGGGTTTSVTFEHNGTGNGFSIELIRSSVEDPIRNIRVILPGFAGTYESQPFHPEVERFFRNFRCLRLMDLMRTNIDRFELITYPALSDWGNRVLPDFYSQSLQYGMAYEYLIQLCNTLNKNAWICIPHAANDHFVRELARLFRDTLNPSLTIFIEYSNEVWNAQFDQYYYANDHGETDPVLPGVTPGQIFYAQRSIEIFRIFRTEFDTAATRIRNVLAGHTRNPNVARNILNVFHNDAYNTPGDNRVRAHAFAIGPYFGNWVGNQIILDGGITPPHMATVDDILDRTEDDLNTMLPFITEHRQIIQESVDPYTQLVAYEGGQHLSVIRQERTLSDYLGANPSITPDRINTLITLLHEANRHDRMRELYCTLFESWYGQGGRMFIHYNSHSLPGKNGSWGLKEYLGQPDAETPKYRALQECVFGVAL